jgi:hypothetical protein
MPALNRGFALLTAQSHRHVGNRWSLCGIQTKGWDVILRQTVSAISAVFLVASLVSSCLQADRVRGAEEVREAQVYVQEFYDWYATQANRAGASGPAWNAIVTMRPTALDSTFLRLLKTDLTEKAKSPPGESVGLDWDPILNTQDPCPSYKADSAYVANAEFRVRVTGVCGEAAGNRSLDVVVDHRRGAWVIMTVRAEEGYDAVRSLKEMQDKK